MEGVLCDVVTRGGDEATRRRLVQRVTTLVDADYLIRLDRRAVTTDAFVRIPRMGPTLACRGLTTDLVPEMSDWELTMGDVELF